LGAWFRQAEQLSREIGCTPSDAADLVLRDALSTKIGRRAAIARRIRRLRRAA